MAAGENTARRNPERGARGAAPGSGRRAAVVDAWRAAAALVATPGLTDRLDLLLELAPQIAGPDTTATIYLRPADSGAPRAIAQFGYERAKFGQPRRGGMTEHVLSTGQMVIVQDAATDSRVNPVVPAAGIRSLVALPLLGRVPPSPAETAPSESGGTGTTEVPPQSPPSPSESHAPPTTQSSPQAETVLANPPLAGAGGATGVDGASSVDRADSADSVDDAGDESKLAGQSMGVLPIGVLYMNARRPYAFTPETLDALQGFAALASVVIENAQLLEAHQGNVARLADALRVREHFTSIVSHELKTPLTPLKGYAQGIRRRLDRIRAGGPPLDQAWLHRALGIMVEQIDRLDNLVTDLLDVSRQRAGRFMVDPQPVDLASLAQGVFQRFSDTLAADESDQEAGIRRALQLRYGAPALPGVWDPSRLEQLMTNLLSNAVKYSPDGGAIELTVELADTGDPTLRQHEAALAPGWVHLAVRDEGIGLPDDPAARQALFEAFTRGANASSARFSGFGLGLFICAQVVHFHGGTIWAESPGPDRGATFHVLLPPVPPAPSSATPA